MSTRMRYPLFVLAVLTAVSGSRVGGAVTYERISVATNGAQANGSSTGAAISADSRYVAFSSTATNLVTQSVPGTWPQVFVRDRAAGTTTLVSVSASGQPANNSAIGASISNDGRFVAFYSYATNLVAASVPGGQRSHVFVRDVVLGTTTLLSASSDGTPANDVSAGPAISANGRFVTFYSYATNLLPGNTGGVKSDIFTRDLTNGSLTRDSVTSDGSQTDRSADFPAVNTDGRFVAFGIFAFNPFVQDMAIRDRVAGRTTLESVATDGTRLANGGGPHLSADGRYVAFSALPPGSSFTALYIRDRQTGETRPVPSDALSFNFSLGFSPDGRYLVFPRATQSGSRSPTILVMYDRTTGGVAFAAPESSAAPAAALNGFAFHSTAALVSDDTNGVDDIYLSSYPAAASVPDPPTSLTGSANGTFVVLNWNAPQTGTAATSFMIEAGSNSGASDLARFDTGSTAIQFSQRDVPVGTYYVRVRSVNSLGASAPSNEVTLVVGTPCAVPSPPRNLSASVSGASVTLTWAPPPEGFLSFVLRVGSIPGGSDLLVTELQSTRARFDAANVPAGTYYVRVQAASGCGQSGPSNEVVVTVR